MSKGFWCPGGGGPSRSQLHSSWGRGHTPNKNVLRSAVVLFPFYSLLENFVTRGVAGPRHIFIMTDFLLCFFLSVLGFALSYIFGPFACFKVRDMVLGNPCSKTELKIVFLPFEPPRLQVCATAFALALLVFLNIYFHERVYSKKQC